MTREDVLKQLAQVLRTHREEALQVALKFGLLSERTMSHAPAEEWLEAQIETASGRSSAIYRWASSYVDGIRSYAIPITLVLHAFHDGRNELIQFLRPLMPEVDGETFLEAVLYMENMTFKAFCGAYAVVEEQASASTRRVQRLIADSVERPFALLDLDGQITLANVAFARLAGKTEDELINQSFHTLCDKETVTELRHEFRSRRPGPAHKFEGALLPFASGKMSPKPVPVQFIVSPIFDNDGFRRGLAVAIAKPTSMSPPVSEALQIRAIRAVADAMEIPAYFLDAEGRVTETNESGKAFEPVWDPEDLDEGDVTQNAVRLDARVFETGEPYRKILRTHLAKGELRWMDVTCLPIRNEEGKVIRAVKLLRDLSAQRMLEEQLLWQQHTSLMSQLAITVAHQLRNPLSVIVGFTEMLSHGMPSEQAPTVIDAIMRNGIRCRDVVQKLLEFGRGTPGDHAPTDLNQLLLDQVKPVFAMVPGITITWQLQEELPPVICAPDQLAHVFACLIDNAIKAPALHVWVETLSSNGDVRVRVRDNGPGVSAEIRDRIFDPFFTTREDQASVGLGLSLSSSVVQEHRGSILLENSFPGACFCVTLPAAISNGNAFTEEPVTPAQQSRLYRVLIVEDEQDLVFLIRLALQARGCQCDTADTVASALELIEQKEYHVAIIDMVLKDASSGRDLYRALQKTHARLANQVIFITGDTVKYETRRFLSEVKRPYLEKPFMLSDFLTVFQKIVAGE